MKPAIYCALFLGAVALGVSGCAPTETAASVEVVDLDVCMQPFAAINREYKVKGSQAIEAASSLACYYGVVDNDAEIACSIPIESAPLFGPDGLDNAGLKDRTQALLLKAEGLGHALAHQRAMQSLRERGEFTNSDRCVSALYKRTGDRLHLHKLFGVLRAQGY